MHAPGRGPDTCTTTTSHIAAGPPPRPVRSRRLAHQALNGAARALVRHKLHRHQVEGGVWQPRGFHVGVHVSDALPLTAAGGGKAPQGGRDGWAWGRARASVEQQAGQPAECHAQPCLSAGSRSCRAAAARRPCGAGLASPRAARQLPLPQLGHRQEVRGQVQAGDLAGQPGDRRVPHRGREPAQHWCSQRPAHRTCP